MRGHSLRTGGIGAAGALVLALLLAALGAPAHAITVTAPTAAILPKQAPVLVQWTTAAGPGVIDIRLIQVTPNASFSNLAIGIPNTGQAVVRLPPSASCDPARTYRLQLFRRITTGNSTATLEWGDSSLFGLSCDDGVRLDRLTVIKKVVNNTAFPTPNTPFQVRVDCSPSGTQSTVTLTSPNSLQRTVTVPPGGPCAITELPPPAPRPCNWITSYPNGRRSMPGGALLVVNELRCKGDDGGGLHGRLTVIKKVVNATGVPTPNAAFQVRVDCSPMGPDSTVTLTYPGALQRTMPVPAGSQCVVTELAPPPPPRPCTWITTYPNGQRSMPGGALLVVNELKCRGDEGGGESGRLSVVKRIVNTTGFPTPNVAFKVQVDCRPSGPQSTVSLAPPNGLSQVLAVPAGSQCTISESDPPAPPKPCAWATSSSPPGQSGGPGATLTVVNTLVCGPRSPGAPDPGEDQGAFKRDRDPAKADEGARDFRR